MRKKPKIHPSGSRYETTDHSSGGSSGANSHGGHKESKRLFVVDERFRELIFVDVDHTLLHKLLGNERANRTLSFMRQNKISKIMHYVWLLSVSLAFPAQMTSEGFFSYLHIPVFILGLPFLLRKYLLVNVELLPEILFTFECVYLITTCMTSAFLWCDMCSFDSRVWPSMLMMLSFMSMMVMDGSPRARKGNHIGLGMYLIYCPVYICYLNSTFAKNVNVKVFDIHWGKVEFYLESIDMLQQSLVLMWLFVLRNFYIIWRHPDCLLLLRPRYKTMKMPKDASYADFVPVKFITMRQKRTQKEMPQNKGTGVTCKEELIRSFNNRNKIASQNLSVLSEAEKGQGKPNHRITSNLPSQMTNRLTYDPHERITFLVLAPKHIGAKEYCSSDTLFRRLLGKRISTILWSLFRSGVVTPILGVMWFVAIWLGFCSFAGWVPADIAPHLWIGFPFLFIGSGFCSPFLLNKLFFTFEVAYILALATVWLFLMLQAVPDERKIMVGIAYFSFYTSCIFDAYHPTAQRFQKFGLVFGALWIVAILGLHLFGYFEQIRVLYFDVHIISRSFKIQNLAFADQRLIMMLCFFAKNLFINLWRPGYFVMLKARLEVKRMTIEEIEQMLLSWRQLAQEKDNAQF